MSANPDRAGAEWDPQQAADRLFTEAGGMAVWVRCGESAARGCVRGGNVRDPATAVLLLAHLALGVDQLIASLSPVLGIPPEVLAGIVREAQDRLEPDTAVRLRRKPPTPE